MDNGVMENFFGRLKVEMFYGKKFESVNNFQTASLHGNKKQTILKVGGGTNGK